MSQRPITSPLERSDRFTNASNNSFAREAFEERKKYADFIFPASSTISRSFNFWGKDKFFGRSNLEGNAVVVLQNRLKQVRNATDTNSCYALDFVADAWRDFCDRVNSEVSSGVLYDSGPYSKLEATVGWRDFFVDYHNYMTRDLYPAFQRTFMSSPVRKRKIRNFNTFLEVFDEFSELIIQAAGPITLSGFVESIYGSVANTGLMIETNRAKHDDDLNKEADFLYDENFNMILFLASQYGFYVDKNAPWRFICDPASKAAQEYMLGVTPEIFDDVGSPDADCDDDAYIAQRSRMQDAYGFSSIPGFENVVRHANGYGHYQSTLLTAYSGNQAYNAMFRSSFQETLTLDMNILKVYLLDFYNRYVATNSSLLIPANTIDKCDKPVNIFREVLDPNVLELYGDKWSLRAFYVLRRRERGIKETAKNELRDLRDIFNYYDFSKGSQNTKLVSTLQYSYDKFVGGLTSSSVSDRIIS